jgi:uncharacterized protein YkwD
MNSPGHKKTILTPSFREFGIGTACIGPLRLWIRLPPARRVHSGHLA